jgi:type VI secretion system secreted protein VgrG
MTSSRIISVKTPLPPDELLIRSAIVTEQLGQPFEMQIELLSRDEVVDFDALLGRDISLSVQLANGNVRYFHGVIAGFSQSGYLGNYVCYRARAVPWLWFLTRTTDCCIFQRKNVPGNCSVPDILKKVFGDHGFTDVKYGLTRSYRPRDYCVQYCESGFNFVQRLMEEEGIYYFFTHAKDNHTLVLADSYSCHEVFPGYETIQFFPPGYDVVRDAEHVVEWALSRNIQSGKYTTTDYDFTKPRALLQSQYVMSRGVPRGDYEVFEYPGKYLTSSEGDYYSRARLESMQAGYETVRGAGNARGIAAGSLFTLKRHPRRDQNRQYLVVSATHRLEAAAYESGHGTSEDSYSCSFEAVDAKQQFRPRATASKTRITGPQTAQVVGPAGEEIFTDKYARVKVKFHWDRDPAHDENSSCWVRVSQVWAGKGWGSVSIPRIGQEVIVDFLEGDPDQPMVTGRVYNQESMPPYELPGAGVVSGVKSHTHKGSGFNEMSMDDTAGKEKINIHGQYDMATTVEHDQTNTVNNDFTETIKNNATISITAGNYSHDVKAGTATCHVQGALVENYDATQTTRVKSNLTVTSAGGAITISADAQNVYINAATNIQLHVGASMIWMDAAGQINIQGVNVAINGSANVTIKGGIVHSEADSEHQTKGAIVMSEGSATNTVKGGMVMLNP